MTIGNAEMKAQGFNPEVAIEKQIVRTINEIVKSLNSIFVNANIILNICILV